MFEISSKLDVRIGKGDGPLRSARRQTGAENWNFGYNNPALRIKKSSRVAKGSADGAAMNGAYWTQLRGNLQACAPHTYH
jgi:hypothetical protein